MSTTITKKFYVDDVLTDPTSIILSDPTGTYGVKRTDNDAVVVADGTAMTKLSTGVYTYSFDDPAYDLTYSYWTEIVYSGETYRHEGSVNGGSVTDAATNALVTIDEVKRWLKLDGSGDDDFLQEAINQWSDTVEKRLQRIIKSAAYTDEQHDGGKKKVLLKNIPVTAISSISIDDTALSSEYYTYDEDSGIIRLKTGYAFDGGPGSIEVSYTGGFDEDSIPGDLKRTVTQLVALEYYLSGRGRKALAKKGESNPQGNVTYERSPVDQELLMIKLERKYARR